MSMKDYTRRGMIASAMAVTLALSACATPTTFHPATGKGIDRTGYSDRMLSANRYEVSFSGNSVTSRDTVDRYLFYRAAQLTIQSGFRTFTMVKDGNTLDADVYASLQPLGPGFGWNGWGNYWAPGWAYHGPMGWRNWAAWDGGPFWGETVDVNTIDRFKASAVIQMSNDPVAPGNNRSYDAQTVIERLASTIKLPK